MKLAYQGRVLIKTRQSKRVKLLPQVIGKEIIVKRKYLDSNSVYFY